MEDDSDGKMKIVFKTSSLELRRKVANTEDRETTSITKDSLDEIKKEIQTFTSDSNESNHERLIACFIKRLYEEKTLCDVLIKVGSEEYPAHKIVLSAHSEKLYNLFAQEHEGKNVELILSDEHQNGVAAVLCFLYTGQIKISPSSIDGLLSVSVQLGFQQILSMCEEYLMKHNISNAFAYYDISERHSLQHIVNVIFKFICNNFLEIIYAAEHLPCSISRMCQFFAEDAIRVINEVDVFYAALAWLDYNRKERMVYAVEIMKRIRFLLMTPEEIATHVETTYIFSMGEIKTMIYQAMRYHALLHTESSLAALVVVPPPRYWLPSSTHVLAVRKHSQIAGQYYEGPATRVTNIEEVHTIEGTSKAGLPVVTGVPQESMTKTRFKNEPSGFHEFSKAEEAEEPFPKPLPMPPRLERLVLVGGLTSLAQDVYPVKAWDHVLYYTPRDNHWDENGLIPAPRHHHAVAKVGQFIYIIGGSHFDSSQPEDLVCPVNTVYRYNLDTNLWRQMAPLDYARMYVNAVVLVDVIYVIGGQDENGQMLGHMEKYNDFEDSWETIPLPRANVGISVAVHMDQIALAGGYCNKTHNAVVDVNFYTPADTSWTKKADLVTGRCHASLVDVKDRLYLIGGATKWSSRDTISSLASISVYDDATDSWSRVAEMRIPRHDITCATLGDTVYIIGGISTQASKSLTVVECFNATKGKMVVDEPIEPLPEPCVGACAVAIPTALNEKMLN